MMINITGRLPAAALAALRNAMWGLLGGRPLKRFKASDDLFEFGLITAQM